MRCPLCKTVGFLESPRQHDLYEGKCMLCGTIRLSGEVEAVIQGDTMKQRALAWHFAQLRSSAPETVTSEKLDEIVSRYRAPQTPLQMIEALVVLIGDRTLLEGSWSGSVHFGPREEYHIIRARSGDEGVQVLAWAIEEELLKAPGGNLQRLTLKGWTKYHDLIDRTRASRTCFVAMPFDAAFDDLFKNALTPAIEASGQWKAYRLDKEEYIGNMPDRMLIEIRRCRFMVADISERNSNVFYEVGVAIGLGKPVITVCNKDGLKELPFDLSQTNHIVWESLEELRERLKLRIAAVIA